MELFRKLEKLNETFLTKKGNCIGSIYISEPPLAAPMLSCHYFEVLYRISSHKHEISLMIKCIFMIQIINSFYVID